MSCRSPTPPGAPFENRRARARAGAALVAVLTVLAAGCSGAAPKATGTTLGSTTTTHASLSRPFGPTVVTKVAGAGGGPTTTTASLDKTVMASAGGLSITLAVTPVRAKSTKAISFNLTASEGQAHGGLEYQIFYGDGKTDQNPAAQYCVTEASLAHATWALTHSYAAPGTYMVTLTAWANCTRDRAKTQSVTVTIT